MPERRPLLHLPPVARHRSVAISLLGQIVGLTVAVMLRPQRMPAVVLFVVAGVIAASLVVLVGLLLACLAVADLLLQAMRAVDRLTRCLCRCRSTRAPRIPPTTPRIASP